MRFRRHKLVSALTFPLSGENRTIPTILNFLQLRSPLETFSSDWANASFTIELYRGLVSMPYRELGIELFRELASISLASWENPCKDLFLAGKSRNTRLSHALARAGSGAPLLARLPLSRDLITRLWWLIKQFQLEDDESRENNKIPESDFLKNFRSHTSPVRLFHDYRNVWQSLVVWIANVTSWELLSTTRPRRVEILTDSTMIRDSTPMTETYTVRSR